MDSVIRGAAIYLILLAIMRLSGRRTMSELTPFDFVLLLIIAETTQQALLGEDFSLSNSVILILTLIVIDILLSLLKDRSRRIRLALDGSATVLMSHGKPDERALHRARVGLGEILEAARSSHGLERADQIRFAILEASGAISIIPEEQ